MNNATEITNEFATDHAKHPITHRRKSNRHHFSSRRYEYRDMLSSEENAAMCQHIRKQSMVY